MIKPTYTAIISSQLSVAPGYIFPLLPRRRTFNSSQALLQAPSCAVSCARFAASQTSCGIYQVPCFCDTLQFQESVKACIGQTCHSTDTGASEYITALCSIRAPAANTSPSDTPSIGIRASTNEAPTFVMLKMTLLGSGLGVILAVML
ncbi:hypothetical protein F5148DRAFT_74847 [Russula earlei]|uniref:Uncharacterized protein n=1 Tax=Russula earlei TaxID=71964 RepID=A0ACC0U7Q4_9AGAM|nr:hypothetical protein F5148DRAFT_74847 [Russula earlei]